MIVTERKCLDTEGKGIDDKNTKVYEWLTERMKDDRSMDEKEFPMTDDAKRCWAVREHKVRVRDQYQAEVFVFTLKSVIQKQSLRLDESWTVYRNSWMMVPSSVYVWPEGSDRGSHLGHKREEDPIQKVRSWWYLKTMIRMESAQRAEFAQNGQPIANVVLMVEVVAETTAASRSDGQTDDEGEKRNGRWT